VVKQDLGIAVSQWDDFKSRCAFAVSKRKVPLEKGWPYFMDVVCEIDEERTCT